MNILKTIGAAFSMFSAIPMPQFEWDSRTMRYLLCAFPLVGIVIGLLCWGWNELCVFAGIPDLLRGAVLCLIPVWTTGGIHLDGYADTCDALSSHQTPDKKQEILKDPHIGSFAVIRLCSYFILMTALWTVLPQYPPMLILPGMCQSRILSALAVASFPMAKNTGLAWTFAREADRKNVKRFLIIMDLVTSIIFCCSGWNGVVLVLTSHAVFGYYYRMSGKEFGGISGDLAGWFLIQAEKWMLITLTVAQLIGERI